MADLKEFIKLFSPKESTYTMEAGKKAKNRERRSNL